MSQPITLAFIEQCISVYIYQVHIYPTGFSKFLINFHHIGSK